MTRRQAKHARMLPCIFLGLLLTPAAVMAVDELSEIGLEDLMEYTVVGASKYAQRPAAVAAAVSVITRDEIRAHGWRTLSEALASLPGTYLRNDRQFIEMGARGFSFAGDFNARLLLTINGNRVNNLIYDSHTFDHSVPLDLALVERIEFIPGPGGAVYGQNALFGVVNVVTRSGASFDGGEVALAYEHPLRGRHGRATWGKRLENGTDVLISASMYRADGEDRFYRYPGADLAYPGLARSEGVARGMDAERDEELFTRIVGERWSFDFAHGDRRKDDPTAIYRSVPLRRNQYQRIEYRLGQLQYQDSFAGDSLQLCGRLFAGQTRYTNRIHYQVPVRTEGLSDWQGVELRLLSTANDAHKLMIGFEYQNNGRVDQYSRELEPPHKVVDIPLSGWRAGLFMQDEWRLTEQLTATIGLRLDDNKRADATFSPRLGLIWSPRPGTAVKALYGRAHREPNAFERDYDNDGYTQVGNPQLDGETVDAFELVFDHQLRADLGVRASVYRWKLRDLINLGVNEGSGLFQYFNGSDVTAEGVELSAIQAWRSGARLRTSLTYQDAASESGLPRNNAPKWLAKASFSSPLGASGVHMAAELYYTGPRRAADGYRMGGYLLSNLNFTTQRWAKGLDLSFGIYNLFDKRYEHPLSVGWSQAVEQDGRIVRLMATYSF